MMKIFKYIRKRPNLFTAIGVVTFVVIATIVVLVVLLAGGDDCHIPPAIPRTLSFLHQDNSLIVSWPKSGFLGHCKHSFLFHYSVNGGKTIEVSTVNYTCIIPNIPGCANVVAEIWTVSETNAISRKSLVEYYTVIPPDGRIINLSAIATTEGVRVTWEKSQELAECETSYRIRYSSDIGDYFNQTTDKSVTIPEDIFCITVHIEVAAVIGHSQTRYASITFQEARILDLRTSIPDPFSPYVMAATWSYPNADLCSLRYSVAFSGEDGQESALMQTLDARVIFLFVYCVLGNITVTPIAFDGTQKGPPTTKQFTEYPDHHIIPRVQFDEFTQTTDGIIVRWFSISAIRNCDLAYNIAFKTELGDFAYIVDDLTYNISRNLFCFRLEIEVLAIAGGISGQSTSEIIRYDIEPVEDLALGLSADGTALVAAWNINRWQEQCGVQYLVTYEHGTVTQSSIESQKSIRFNTAYCATTTVCVSVAYGAATSKEVCINFKGENPTLLPPVQNISFSQVGTSMAISWDLFESVNQCPYLYSVTANNINLDLVDRCEGIKGCKIALDSFCPYTEVTITPIILPGESVTKRYSCGSSNEL